MPLRTFHNLKPERQREIVDACLEEFVLNGYQGASLTRIIQKLGLAKGSFYRYFESKEKLYAYLIELGKRNTQILFEEAFKEPVDDILDAWVRFYLACARQDNADPLLGYFGYVVYIDRANIILGDVPLKSKARGLEFLKNLFKTQQDRGRIRTDVDLDVLIYTLLQVQEGFLDYLTLKYKIDFAKNVKKRRALFPIPEKVLEEELRQFSEVLRHGLFRNETQPKGGYKNVG
jgi:TetR/AcrR family transcriptional regulator